jgi:osmotically-inducible protein OsmY
MNMSTGGCPHSCTDSNITEAVRVKIYSDRCMSDQKIHVTTYERTVTLKGRVSNPTQKSIASQMARSVPGVKGVRNQLAIQSLDNG